MNIFRIRDIEFEIEETAILGTVNTNGSLTWALDVNTKRKSTPELNWVGPLISCKGLVHPAIADRKLAKLEWQDVRAYYNDDWHGDIYIYDADEYHECHITLTRIARTVFALQWKGLCDVNAGEGYGKRVPFYIETHMEFIGIASEIENESDARETLAKYCDDTNFKWVTLESGFVFYPIVF